MLAILLKVTGPKSIFILITNPIDILIYKPLKKRTYLGERTPKGQKKYFFTNLSDTTNNQQVYTIRSFAC